MSSVRGAFAARSVVSIADDAGLEFARGMVLLSSQALDGDRAADRFPGKGRAAINPHDYVILEAS